MHSMMSRCEKWFLRCAGVMVIAALAACGGTEDDSTTKAGDGDDGNDSESVEYTINPPSKIAQESDGDYDNNVNGLITGNTLKGWMDDWQNNRPDDVEGKLVILQVSAGETGYAYINHDDENVFTYLESDVWKATRSNGVIETMSMVPSGATMDAMLAEYDIDPSDDMIVCAMGEAGGAIMTAGRCWYTFRYWGTPKENLAMLNGGNEWLANNTDMTGSDFAGGASTPPNNGTASVKDLAEVNVALQATLQDMIAAVPATDDHGSTEGIFIWDARSLGEYNPTDDSTFKNDGATQGHPNGALLLEWTDLLNTEEGYTFKSKSDIADYLTGTANGFMTADEQYVQGPYQSDDTIYTYCETTWRAMVTGFASGAILGLPTRFYDGAMYEWHSMANVTASDGYPLLPSDSPWRTDKDERSMVIPAGDSNDVEPRTIVDPYAESADAIVVADKAYKTGDGSETDTDATDDTGDDDSDDSSLPPNPCG